MGGLTRRAGANPHEVVNRLAERTGAEADRHAGAVHGQHRRRPRTCCSASTDVAEAFALAEGCDLMLVGIGTTVHEAELVATGMIEAAEIAAIARAGGVGEMLGHFFDDARPPGRERADRSASSPSRSTRLRGRRIVAVAGGAIKVDAIRAVLASGLLSRPHHRRAHRPRHRRRRRATCRQAQPRGDGGVAMTTAPQPQPCTAARQIECWSPHNDRRQPRQQPPDPRRSGSDFDLVRILLEGRAFFALIVIIVVFSILSPNYFSVVELPDDGEPRRDLRPALDRHAARHPERRHRPLGRLGARRSAASSPAR